MSTTSGAEDTLPQLVTSAWLAEQYGVTPETIRNWAKKGMPKVGFAKYEPRECAGWIKRNERVEGAKLYKAGKSKYSKEEWDLRRAAAITLQEELQLSVKRREVVSITVIKNEIDGILEGMRLQLKSIPGQWAGAILGLDTKAIAQDKLNGLVDELMEGLSKPPELPNFEELERLEQQLIEDSDETGSDTEGID